MFLRAQPNASSLQVNLLGRTFFLRSLCAGDDLHFDAAGKPRESCTPEPFTVGLLTVDRVETSATELKLTAHRVGLAFRDNVPQQVDLSHPRRGRKPHAVVLHLAPSPSGDFATTVGQVLSESYDTLLPSVPEAWQNFFQAHLLSSAHAPQAIGRQGDSLPLAQLKGDAKQVETSMGADSGPASAGQHASDDDVFPYSWAKSVTAKAGKDGVAVPQVLRQRESSYSPQAKSILFTGRSVIRLIVDEDGVPQHLVVRSPAGLALDEEALAAIAQYRFQPVTKDGKPVAVEMNIQTSFEIY